MTAATWSLPEVLQHLMPAGLLQLDFLGVLRSVWARYGRLGFWRGNDAGERWQVQPMAQDVMTCGSPAGLVQTC